MSEKIEMKFNVSEEGAIILLDARKLQNFVDGLYDDVFRQKIKYGTEEENKVFQTVWDEIIDKTDYKFRVLNE